MGAGKLDLVVAGLSGINSSSPGISVLLGNGDGTFQLAGIAFGYARAGVLLSALAQFDKDRAMFPKKCVS